MSSFFDDGDPGGLQRADGQTLDIKNDVNGTDGQTVDIKNDVNDFSTPAGRSGNGRRTHAHSKDTQNAGGGCGVLQWSHHHQQSFLLGRCILPNCSSCFCHTAFFDTKCWLACEPSQESQSSQHFRASNAHTKLATPPNQPAFSIFTCFLMLNFRMISNSASIF